MVLVPEGSCILRNYETTWTQRLLARLIRCGPMPKHVAFIMDGNRRYARENKMPHVWDGHKVGGERMQEVANMLLDLGVEEMTVFSFSTDNYNRSPDEVKAIMGLVKERYDSMLQGIEEMRQLGVNAEMLGSWEKVRSPNMRSRAAKAAVLSKGNHKLKLHVAFAYSAHDEICDTVTYLVNGLCDGAIQEEDLDEYLFQECMSLLPNNNPIDLLVRTSGECRLSDFQLWQSSQAYLDFVDATWPEYSFWDLLGGIWRYQHHVTFMPLSLEETVPSTNQARVDKQVKFVETVRDNKWDKIKSYIIG